MKVIIKNVRLSFPNLFQPQSVNGSEPKFNASFLLEPGSDTAQALEAAIEQTAKDKWGAKADAILKQLRAADKTCLHNGDSKDYDGYAGMLYVSASNPSKPLIFDKDGRTHLDSTSGRPYAGCYVNASLDIWAQDSQYGKRINAGLRGVQFIRHGEAFTGGGVASEDEFADLAVTDDEEEGLALV